MGILNSNDDYPASRTPTPEEMEEIRLKASMFAKNMTHYKQLIIAELFRRELGLKD